MADCLELEDPIREMTSIFQKWTLRALILAVLLTIAGIGVAMSSPTEAVGTVALVGTLLSWLLVFVAVGVLVWWRAFAPRHITDAFYLRSFQNDVDTWPIRVEIQRALGNKLRLSGIRDPRRRKLGLKEKYSPIYMAMKYCTPRHMDLVAGNDWIPRLWHSLRKGQLAFIDLSTPTPAVREETRIVTDALGFDRVVFLGHAPQTADDIRAILTEELGADVAAGVGQIVIWPGKSSRKGVRGFRKQIRSLADSVQKQPLLPPDKTCPDWCGPVQPIPQGRRHSDRMFGDIVKLQALLLVLQVVVQIAVGLAGTLQPGLKFIGVLIAGPFALVNMWLLVQNWFLYIRDVGIPWDRIKASIGFVSMMSPLLFSVGQALIFASSSPSDSSRKAEVTPLSGAELAELLQNDRDEFQQEDSQRGPNK